MINNKGFSTAIALIITAIILTVLAGLLPAASSMLKMTKINQYGEIAQAAAEAGAKKAISYIYELNQADETIPNTYTASGNIINYNAQNTNEHGSYSVTYHTDGNIIRITSVGTCTSANNNITRRTVSVDLHFNNGSSSIYNTGFYDYYIVAFSPKKIYAHNVAVHRSSSYYSPGFHSKTAINGRLQNSIAILDQWSDSVFGLGDTVCGYVPNKSNLETNKYALIFPWIDFIATESPTYPLIHKDRNVKIYTRPFWELKKYCADYTEILKKDTDSYSFEYKNGKCILKQKARNRTFFPGWYYIDASLVIDGGGNLLNPKKFAGLYRKTNAVFFIDGDLIVTNSARIGYHDSGDQRILLLVNGNVEISQNAGINHAMIICTGKFKMYNTSNFCGAIQAAGNIDTQDTADNTTGISIDQESGFLNPEGLSYCNLVYDRNVVRDYRDIIAAINSPDYNKASTFYISNWH